MTWKKLELRTHEVLMCDDCERMICSTIVYVYSDDSNNYINEVLCEECYNQGEKN